MFLPSTGTLHGAGWGECAQLCRLFTEQGYLAKGPEGAELHAWLLKPDAQHRAQSSRKKLADVSVLEKALYVYGSLAALF